MSGLINQLRYFAFTFVLALPLIFVTSAWAQDQLPGAPKGWDGRMLQQAQQAQGPFINPTFQQDESTFSSTVYTFDDIVIFSYFDDTEITIVSSTGDTVAVDTLARNTYKSHNFSSGVYSVNGSKSYTLLIGDPLSASVQGYFAVDQSGRGTSTLLNTYMMSNQFNQERFIVFAYSDNTNFSIKDLTTGNTLASGVLNQGEHYTMPSTPYQTFIQVTANKAVSALAYGDQDYYVPSANGTFSGTLFYGYSAYIGSWTNSITVNSYHDNNIVRIYNTETGDTLAHDTLGVGQVISLPITEETYWEVHSSKTVTTANIPFANWSGNYAYMARSIDLSGSGAGTLFYVPTIGSQVDIFSYEDGNEVLITRLGDYQTYPYADSAIVYDDTMSAGDGYRFNAPSGNNVYKIEGSSNLSVVQSYQGFGADFMPLSFAQRLPDLALTEQGLSFSPPDSELTANQRATAHLTVYNYGPVEANNITVNLYDGDINNEGTAPIIASQTITHIPGNGSATVSADFVVPENPEFKILSLVVDPDDEITESNNSNNSIIRSLLPNRDLLPPLSVTTNAPAGLEIQADTLFPNPFSVTATFINNGTVSAKDVSVEMNTFDGLTIAEGEASTTRDSLSADGNWVLVWKLRANPDSSGTNRYQLVVDASNAEIKMVNRSVIVPDATPPGPPENFTASSPDSVDGVLLQWAANMEPDLSGYLVYYGTSSGNYNGTMADQGSSPISISTFSSYNITGLADGSTYYFNMKAVDQSNNNSAFTTERMVTVTTALDPIADLPEKYNLEQNHPNPFNPTTVINYAIPEASEVQLEVFNLLGRKVATLVDQRQNAGYHTVNFDARSLSSGIYIYRISAKGFTQTRKMLLIK